MLILASASPRRAALLHEAGIPFVQKSIPHEESLDPLFHELQMTEGLSAEEAAARVVLWTAQSKYEIARETLGSASLILCADTIVFAEAGPSGEAAAILGKPRDRAEARAMLRRLAGHAHEVMTGVVLGRGSEQKAWVSRTRVRFLPWPEDETLVERYYRQPKVLDYAGAYGIQDDDFPLLDGIDGELSNVIGLPVGPCLEALRAFGYPR